MCTINRRSYFVKSWNWRFLLTSVRNCYSVVSKETLVYTKSCALISLQLIVFHVFCWNLTRQNFANFDFVLTRFNKRQTVPLVMLLFETLWTKTCPFLHSSFTKRCTFIKILIKIYIKIRWLLHVSVYDHHQGAYNWAWLKLYWY